MTTTIRISRYSMAFAMQQPDQGGRVRYERYPAKTGISAAANLRKAFTDSQLLSLPSDEAVILVDAPVSLIPLEEYDEQTAATLYKAVLPVSDGEEVEASEVEGLHAVATFALSRDLKVVVGDHFQRYRFVPVVQPVWSYLYQNHFEGSRRRLFAYFHDRKVDLVAFRQNRFQFSNTFDATHCADAVYYLLNTWKQLGLSREDDALYIVGGVAYAAELDETLSQYLTNIHKINTTSAAEGREKPLRTIMPFDVQALYALQP